MKTWEELTRMERLGILLSGGFGGMAPLLVGMARQLLSGQPDQGVFMALDPVSWIGCVMIGVVSAGVVWVYGECLRKKAFGLGATAPALVMGLVAGGTDGGERLTLRDLLSPTSLYAEEEAHTQPPRMDSVWIQIRGLSELPLAANQVPRITLASGETGLQDSEFSQIIRDFGSEPFLLRIPEGAQDLYLSLGTEISNRLDLADLGLSRGDSVTLSVERKSASFWSRLGRPFGARHEPGQTLVIAVVRDLD